MLNKIWCPSWTAALSIAATSWALAAGTATVGSGTPDGFSQVSIEQAYAAVIPGVCLLTYSSEVTNPNSGEQTKRDTRAACVIVSKEGLVMAHGHMALENSEPFNIRVKVRQKDAEQEYEAKLLKKPDDVNVCFLQIQHTGPLSLPYVPFALSSRLRLGQPVLVFGLLGETLDFNDSVMTRRVGSILEKPRMTYCIDQPVPFGFVGGPVVDAGGAVVGVVGFDLTQEEGGEVYTRSGQPLVYQSDLFHKYIENPPSETNTHSRQDDAWLGVFTQPLTDDLAEYWGIPADGGVVLSTLVPGAPGEVAGLKRGDVIIDLSGTPIRAKQDRDVSSFTKLVRDTGAGKEVTLKVLRGGQPLEVRATLAGRPKSARDAGEFEDPVFGITVREMTTDVRLLLNLSEDVQGVIVRRVKSGSWADLARVPPGVIIMNFGNYPVTNLESFKQAVAKVAAEKPKEVAVFCRAQGQTGFFRLQPRW